MIDLTVKILAYAFIMFVGIFVLVVWYIHDYRKMKRNKK